MLAEISDLPGRQTENGSPFRQTEIQKIRDQFLASGIPLKSLLCEAMAMFELGNNFSYVGIRFMPSAFPLLFNVNASTFTNTHEDLFDVVPSLARDLATQFDQKHAENLQEGFDAILLIRLGCSSLSEDKRLSNAVNIVLKSHGNVNLTSEVDTGISPRQLRRLFQFYIGDTPKAFSKVLRFQHFLKLQSLSATGANKKIFLDAGYYDQPHFNKEFKSFFGLTPKEALFL